MTLGDEKEGEIKKIHSILGYFHRKIMKIPNELGGFGYFSSHLRGQKLIASVATTPHEFYCDIYKIIKQSSSCFTGEI